MDINFQSAISTSILRRLFRTISRIFLFVVARFAKIAKILRVAGKIEEKRDEEGERERERERK